MVTEAPLTRHPVRRRGLRHATGRMLPTLATLGNLICGFAAIYYAAKGARATVLIDQHADPGKYLNALEGMHLTYFAVAAWLIFLAMIFDALDGRLARLVRSTSDLGAQLDSLADVVSFGLAPAFLMVELMIVRVGGQLFDSQWVGSESGEHLVGRTVWVIGAIFASCAALRLARFNVETTADEAAHMWFKGLPSPGAAAALASLVLLLENLAWTHPAAWAVKTVFWVLPPVALAVALMMVASVPYPHATNHFIRGRHSFRKLVIALLLVGLLLIFKVFALAVIAVGYALSGPIILQYRRWVRKDYRTSDELAAAIVTDEDEAEGDAPGPGEE